MSHPPEESTQDSAEQEHAQSAIAYGPAYYQALFQAAMDVILVADEHGRYLDANNAATALLGYTRQELLGLRVDDVVASGPVWAAAEYTRFLHEGTWSGDLELRRRDGALVPVEAHATVVRQLEGPPIFLSMLRDISARRSAEQAQQDFLAMVTHDLRNPLTAILGQAQLMQRRAAYSQASTDGIIANAGRLRRLIDDLLDVAQFAAGHPELRRSAVDLTRLAAETAAQALMVTPTHAIRVVAPEQPITGMWDGDRIAQILQNLISNAVKYAAEGTEIVLCLEPQLDDARVSVRDQGMGIATNELPRLFDRFYRTESATRGGAPGLGLGLHICKLLVEAHGGRIWIESALGEGTTVSFTLPYNQPGTS